MRAENVVREDQIRAEDIARQDQLLARQAAQRAQAQARSAAQANAKSAEISRLLGVLSGVEVDAASQKTPDFIPGGPNRLQQLMPTDGSGKQTSDQKAVLRMQQLKPDLANEVLQTIASGDEKQIRGMRNLATSGVELADKVLAAPDLAAKKQIIQEYGAAAVARGESPDGYVEMLQIPDGDQLNLAARTRQVFGNDVKEITKPQKPKTMFDTQEKIAALTQLRLLDPEAAKGLMETDKYMLDVAGGGQTGSYSKTPGVLVRKPDGSLVRSTGVLNNHTGGMTNNETPVSDGELVSVYNETAMEDRNRDVEAAGRTTEVTSRKKTQEDRINKSIQAGIVAADATATLRKSINLLDSVKTGGINNLSLWAKQKLGVESADEGELSNLLGKAVVSQLRDTFGAAFTAREGDLLKSIEAGFGKSPEANKVLLNNALKISERSAKRGLRAAESIDDFLSIDEISNSLEFSLGDPEYELAPIPSQSGGRTINQNTIPKDARSVLMPDGSFAHIDQDENLVPK